MPEAGTEEKVDIPAPQMHPPTGPSPAQEAMWARATTGDDLSGTMFGVTTAPAHVAPPSHLTKDMPGLESGRIPIKPNNYSQSILAASNQINQNEDQQKKDLQGYFNISNKLPHPDVAANINPLNGVNVGQINMSNRGDATYSPPAPYVAPQISLDNRQQVTNISPAAPVAPARIVQPDIPLAGPDPPDPEDDPMTEAPVLAKEEKVEPKDEPPPQVCWKPSHLH